MSDPYIGEIRVFAGNFAPRGWLFCMGQLIAISDASYQALFSIVGTHYGGDGRTTFGVPDLRGRAPMHWGNSQAPGLSDHFIGQESGRYEKAITVDNMPPHTHGVNAVNEEGTLEAPSNDAMLALAQATTGPVPKRAKELYSDYDQASLAALNPEAVNPTGPPNGQPLYLNNYQPYLACSFIINWDGLYPPRP